MREPFFALDPGKLDASSGNDLDRRQLHKAAGTGSARNAGNGRLGLRDRGVVRCTARYRLNGDRHEKSSSGDGCDTEELIDVGQGVLP